MYLNKLEINSGQVFLWRQILALQNILKYQMNKYENDQVLFINLNYTCMQNRHDWSPMLDLIK